MPKSAKIKIMEDAVYFIVRYIPFWAIPTLLICGQFAYIYWLKEVRWVSIVLIVCCVIALISLVYYMFAGSPHDAAALIRDNIFH